MTIHLLADEVISQIAAGEVVERPASVVKELIENALDAQSTAITIRIEEGGLDLIEVSDDGLGIPQAEIELALQRNATSKIQQASDLFHIQTLGFRGEALASMASVSRLTMTSRHKGVEIGGELFVDGGRYGALKTLGVPEGTVVRVENLFYNVPARLAFLKKTVTEKSRITALVNRYALAYPQVRWQLYQDHKPVLRTAGNGDRREILAAMYGVGVSKEMIEVNLADEGMHVYGYISPLEITRSHRRELTFFLNGRWIQDSSITSALLSAYQNILPPKRYPVAAIFIEIDPEQVDVNVHPAKAEVRFRDPSLVFSTVQRAVKRAFLAFTPLDAGTGNPSIPSSGRTSADTGMAWRGFGQSVEKDPAWLLAGLMKREEALEGDSRDFGVSQVENQQNLLIPEELSLFQLIGDFKGRYLLAEAPDGLYLIDEKAAMERITYETFLRKAGEASFDSTTLEESVIASAQQNLDDWLPVYEKLGYSLESFGPKDYRLNAVPTFFQETGSINEIFSALLNLDYPTRLSTIEEKSEWLLVMISQVIGEFYSTNKDRTRQQELLARLQMCHSPRYCPDGRATLIHLSLDSLDQQFHSN